MSKRHAVVTGGGRGIGAATARALAEAGFRVTVMGRNVQHLDAVAAEVNGVRIQVDVTDSAEVARAFEQAGSMDVLVNNAGAIETAPFGRTTRETWGRMLDINVTAAFTCTQAVLGGMRAAKYGRIVNVASTAALIGYPYVTAYCAAKHALLGLTRALAKEVAKDGITVNAVCPGYTETDLLAESLNRIVTATGRTEKDARELLVKSNPQGRFITPEEVAATIAWLCSDAASGITGQAVAIDGGETA